MARSIGRFVPQLGIGAVAALLAVLLARSQASAQPDDGKPQPDRITLGTVYIGATVEASVRVLIRGDDFTGLEVKTSPPPFLRVTQSRLGTQKYGALGTFVTCDVFVSLNTSQTGELDDKLSVRVGQKDVVIPVSAKIIEKDPHTTRVLVVETPISRFSTNDASHFDAWLKLVSAARLDVSTLEVDHGLPVLRDLDLLNFDVILLGGTGIFSAKEEDLHKLKTFVESGGRVIVTANYFFRGTVEAANKFIVPLGLKMADTEPKNGNSLVELEESDIPRHKLTEGVRKAKFFRPSPVTVEDSTSGTILLETPFDPEKGLVAVARFGKGEVVVVGTSLWWRWISSEEESGADNVRLLQNLLTSPRQVPPAGRGRRYSGGRM
jgi:hypothetical protein